MALGLTAYAQALAKCRDVPRPAAANNVTIVSGYRPGMIGRIAQMHGEYYARHHGFGHFSKVRSPAGWRSFLPDLTPSAITSGWPCWRATSSAPWPSMVKIWAITKRIYAGLFSTTAVGAAALADACWPRRWLLRPSRFSAVQLWTFSGLHAARALYESFGFTLHKEWQGDQWGW